MSDGRSQQRVNLGGGERGRNRLSAPDAKFNNLNSNNSHIVSTHSIGRVVTRITNTHKNQD